MASADLTLPDGTKVRIDGSAEEVASLLNKISTKTRKELDSSSSAKQRKATKKKAPRLIGRRKGLQRLLNDLAEESYFKSKRTIGDVQQKLEEKGDIYPLTRISTPLLRLTRARVLRRIKEKGGWVYVS